VAAKDVPDLSLSTEVWKCSIMEVQIHQSNVDNWNNVKCEASKHFRNKNKAYLKAKFEEFETNSMIKNIRDLYRGIYAFKKLPV